MQSIMNAQRAGVSPIANFATIQRWQVRCEGVIHSSIVPRSTFAVG